MPQASEKHRAAPRSIAAEILAAQECERKRVAQALHENFAQTVAAAKMRVECALAALDSGNHDTTKDLLREIVPLLQGALDEGRRMCAELRPRMLDDLGLAATISGFCSAFRAAHPDIELGLELQLPRQDLPDPVKTAIYRVLQEATENAARHAQATSLLVRLRQRRQGIDLLVADNGRGFGAAVSVRARSGLGLAIMKEWVESLSGTFRVGSTPCGGVRVRARWPLADPPQCSHPQPSHGIASAVS